jgi:DNA primase small subunit
MNFLVNEVKINEPLKHYYEEYFPFENMFKWLSYGSKDYFYKREFSFTIKDMVKDEEYYLRYRAFKDFTELKKSVLEKVPNKIDLGPAYTVSVKLF